MHQTFPGMQADAQKEVATGPQSDARQEAIERDEVRHGNPDFVPGREERGEFAWMVGMSLADIERHAVLQTLAACSGNKARAARMLGVSEKTIYNKLKQYRRHN